MAARFWVLGTGNWDNADTSHWAATSGGAPGASVPTAADDVTFDANSGNPGAYTVTTAGAAPCACKNLTFAAAPSGGGTVTWAGANTMNVSGSLVLLAGMVRTFSASLQFLLSNSAKTIQCNGVTLPNMSFFGSALDSYTLQDTVSLGTGDINHIGGALNFNGQTVNCGSLISNGATVRSLIFGAATINLSDTGNAYINSGSNLTISAALATFNFSTGNSSFASLVAAAYGTVNLVQCNASQLINAGGSFVNLAIAPQVGVSTGRCAIDGDFTVSGLLTISGVSNAAPIMIQTLNPGGGALTYGTRRKITAAAVALTDVDFMDIEGAGAAVWAGTRVCDAGGNLNIAFAAPVTRYWVATTGGNWNVTTSWSATSGGASGASTPRCQDTVIFDANSITSPGRTITANAGRLGKDVSFAGLLNSPTINFSGGEVYGSFALGAGVGAIIWQILQFRGRGNHTIAFAGKGPAIQITFAGFGGTYTAQDDISSSSVISFEAGTFDANGKNITANAIRADNSTIAKTVRLGSGTWTVTGSTLIGSTWRFAAASCTLVPGTSTIKFTDVTASPKVFDGGGKTYYNLWFSGAGAGIYQIVGSNTFNQFKTDVNRTVQFTAGTNTTAADFQFGNGAIIGSITAANHTLTKTGPSRVIASNVTVSRSTALPAVGVWTALYGTDGGNNTGWDFAASAALFSWPMMYIGDGDPAPAEFVDTDAGDVLSLNPDAPLTTAWSNNPALCLHDFMVRYAGLTVDMGHTANAANYDDQLMSNGEKRNTITLALTEMRDCGSQIDDMRAYVPGWVVDAGDAWRIVADMPRATDHFFGPGTIDSDPPPRIKRTGSRDTPNAVDIAYTDERVKPWKTQTAYVELPVVIDLRRNRTQLPGIRRYSQAYRFAIERLNHYTLEDVTGTLPLFDYGLKVLAGDVASISEPAFGWSGKLVRILEARDKGNGRWEVDFREYDPAAYSDTVQIAPSNPDTSLSTPLTVVAPTGLLVTEILAPESLMPNDGLARGLIYQSRIRVQWTGSTDPYIDHHLVRILLGSDVIFQQEVRGTESYLSSTVQQLRSYTVELYAVNSLGVMSLPLSTSIFIDGKQFPPGDVPAITRALEIGGDVLLEWQPAADFDTLRYEWRVDLGNAGIAWDLMQPLDRVDGLRARFKGLPIGIHRFCVKAIDSVGLYSVNTRCAVVTVTSDSDAYLSDVTFIAPTLTRMVITEVPWSETESPTLRPRWMVSDATTSWDASMPNPINSGVLPVIAYGAGAVGKAIWLGETYDFGSEVVGDFSIVSNILNLVGTAKVFFEHSTDGIAWTSEDLSSGTAWKGLLRFFRPRFESNAIGDSWVLQGYPKVNIVVVRRTESGGPVLSSASLASTVSLVNRYSKVIEITITPLGTGAVTFTIDNIVLGAGVPNTFDVYLFDATTGAQIASNYLWSFTGV